MQPAAPEEHTESALELWRQRQHVRNTVEHAINNRNARMTRRLDIFNVLAKGVMIMTFFMLVAEVLLAHTDLEYIKSRAEDVSLSSKRHSAALLTSFHLYIYQLLSRSGSAIPELAKLFYDPHMHSDDSFASVLEGYNQEAHSAVEQLHELSLVVDNLPTNSKRLKKMRHEDVLQFSERNANAAAKWSWNSMSLRDVATYGSAFTSLSLFSREPDMNKDYAYFFIMSNIASGKLDDALEISTNYVVEELTDRKTWIVQLSIIFILLAVVRLFSVQWSFSLCCCTLKAPKLM